MFGNLLQRYLGVILTLLFLIAGCAPAVPAASPKPTQKGEYILTLSGKVSEAGVISYAGYEMNVYKDYASNPCGDCAYQPVSVYAGAGADEIVQAMAKAVTRADDVWTVQKAQDNTLILKEKTPGEGKETAEPSAPAGLEIKGEYCPGD